MKKYIKYLLFLASLMVMLQSCDSQLEVTHQGTISDEGFYKTDEDAMESITAVYNVWRGQYFNWFYLKNMLSDDNFCGGGSRGDNSDFELINEYQFSQASSTVSGTFSSFYQVIYQANLIVDKIEPDTEVKERVVAEAKVARAWAMTELITLWGPVPFADHVLSSSEYQLPNGDIPTMWAWVEQNLSEAADVLPSKASPNGQEAIGARVTREAALSFLGKAQVFEGKYAEAATTLKKVINSGLYELVPNFDEVLRVSTDFGPENIFESNAIDDPDNAWSQGTMLFSLMMNWRTSQLTKVWDGAWSEGWGFYNPTKELYKAFVEMEGTDGYRLNHTMKTYKQLTEDFGIDIKSYLYGNEGYMNWKLRFPSNEVVTNSYGYLSHNNPRWMRYAEVLLLAAEACVQSGDVASATTYVNAVRSRAQLAPLASVTMDDVKKEKRLELCFECCRYQDLVRWGDAPTVLADRGKEIPQLNADGSVTYPFTNSSYGFKAGKHELLPIPEHEMNVNKNIHQNTGW